MRIVPSYLIAGLTIGAWILNPSLGAAAERPQERIALLLSGDHCAQQVEAVRQALAQIPGVLAVDGGSVPDHLLVDRAHTPDPPEHLADVANAVLSTRFSCRAEIMRSCISAGAVDPHAPH